VHAPNLRVGVLVLDERCLLLTTLLQPVEGHPLHLVGLVEKFYFVVRSASFTCTSIFFPPRYNVTATVSPGRLRFNILFTSN
jgi:hypothetical protein